MVCTYNKTSLEPQIELSQSFASLIVLRSTTDESLENLEVITKICAKINVWTQKVELYTLRIKKNAGELEQTQQLCQEPIILFSPLQSGTFG